MEDEDIESKNVRRAVNKRAKDVDPFADPNSESENEDSESENEVVKANQDAAAEVEQDAPESVTAEEKQSTLTC